MLEEVKNSIRGYYSDNHKPDGTITKISASYQAGTFQKYLNNIDRFNVDAKMIDNYLVHSILTRIISYLC